MSVNKKTNFRCLVTGANGMLARAVAGHCLASGDEVTALTRAELDISDREAAARGIAEMRPDIVFNCAAFTNVDLAESDPEACFAANSIGPENLALACRDTGATLVTISTDYVFDGGNNGFYIETDVPAPLGVYGRSKLEGEQRVAAANPEAIIIRSGWIFGHGGNNFLSVIPSLVRERKPFTAISDAFGTPTFAGDLARRLRELAIAGVSGVIHVANSGSLSSYYGLALQVCEILGAAPDIVTPIAESDLKRAARRPKSSGLRSVRYEETGLGELPDWRVSIESFLAE